MSYTDKTLTCRECGQQFVWTTGEQEFYASRGLLHQPSRCPTCRRARKMAAVGESAAAFERPVRQMYAAVCDNCGKQAMVPFQPTSGKPVYCSECFEQVRASRGLGPTRRSDVSYETRY
jgi:CxxC-x17-CxxC domain-containing protein